MPSFRLGELRPSRRFVLETDSSPEEATATLQANVGPRTWGFGGGDSGPPFVGQRVGPMGFAISRAITYRNSFLPVLHVTIEPRPSGGARVDVAMRMALPVIVFMAVWMTGASVGAILGGWVAFARHEPFGLVAVVFPLFAAALAGGGFAYEARRAEELLRGLFAPAPPYR